MRLSGEIKVWFGERGFGFIKRDDGLGDIFVHVRDLRDRSRDEMAAGERVTFDTAERNGKNCAADVAVETGR